MDDTNFPSQPSTSKAHLKSHANEERLIQIFEKEIDREVAEKMTVISKISDNIRKCQKDLDRLRKEAVIKHYMNSCQDLNSDKQPSIHPAVKKIIGKRPAALSGTEKYLKSNIWKWRRETRKKLHKKYLSHSNKHKRRASENLSNNESAVKPCYVPPTIPGNPQENSTLRGNSKKMHMRILVGNIAKQIDVDSSVLDSATHKWMVYVRSAAGSLSIEQQVSKIRFFLHPSYKPNDVITVPNPPFTLHRRGWGEFPMRVQLYFKNSINKPVDIIHTLRLNGRLSGHHTRSAETFADLWIYPYGSCGETGDDKVLSNQILRLASNMMKEEVPEFSSEVMCHKCQTTSMGGDSYNCSCNIDKHDQEVPSVEVACQSTSKQAIEESESSESEDSSSSKCSPQYLGSFNTLSSLDYTSQELEDSINIVPSTSKAAVENNLFSVDTDLTSPPRNKFNPYTETHPVEENHILSFNDNIEDNLIKIDLFKSGLLDGEGSTNNVSGCNSDEFDKFLKPGSELSDLIMEPSEILDALEIKQEKEEPEDIVDVQNSPMTNTPLFNNFVKTEYPHLSANQESLCRPTKEENEIVVNDPGYTSTLDQSAINHTGFGKSPFNQFNFSNTQYSISDNGLRDIDTLQVGNTIEEEVKEVKTEVSDLGYTSTLDQSPVNHTGFEKSPFDQFIPSHTKYSVNDNGLNDLNVLQACNMVMEEVSIDEFIDNIIEEEVVIGNPESCTNNINFNEIPFKSKEVYTNLPDISNLNGLLATKDELPVKKPISIDNQDKQTIIEEAVFEMPESCTNNVDCNQASSKKAKTLQDRNFPPVTSIFNGLAPINGNVQIVTPIIVCEESKTEKIFCDKTFEKSKFQQNPCSKENNIKPGMVYITPTSLIKAKNLPLTVVKRFPLIRSNVGPIAQIKKSCQNPQSLLKPRLQNPNSLLRPTLPKSPIIHRPPIENVHSLLKSQIQPHFVPSLKHKQVVLKSSVCAIKPNGILRSNVLNSVNKVNSLQNNTYKINIQKLNTSGFNGVTADNSKSKLNLKSATILQSCVLKNCTLKTGAQSTSPQQISKLQNCSIKNQQIITQIRNTLNQKRICLTIPGPQQLSSQPGKIRNCHKKPTSQDSLSQEKLIVTRPTISPKTHIQNDKGNSTKESKASQKAVSFNELQKIIYFPSCSIPTRPVNKVLSDTENDVLYGESEIILPCNSLHSDFQNAVSSKPYAFLVKKAIFNKDYGNSVVNEQVMYYFEQLRLLVNSCQFEVVDKAVRWLVRGMPMVHPDAKLNSYKIVHPYCAATRDVYCSWSRARQAAAEWLRAKTVVRILTALKAKNNLKENVWSTKTVYSWCRLHGYSPGIRLCGSGSASQNDKFVQLMNRKTPPKKVIDWMASVLREPRIQEKEEEIDVIGVTSNERTSVKTREPVDTDRALLCGRPWVRDMSGLVRRQVARASSKLGLEPLAPNEPLQAVASTLMCHLGAIFAEDLLRRSLAAASLRDGSSIEHGDVCKAIVQRPEFDLFTQEGLDVNMSFKDRLKNL